MLLLKKLSLIAAALNQRLKKFCARWVCSYAGHDFHAAGFSFDTLNFCRRCGEEISGRTFADLEPSQGDPFDAFGEFGELDEWGC